MVSQLELWLRSNVLFHLEMMGGPAPDTASELEHGASCLSVQRLPEFLRGFVRCLFISHLP